MTLVDVLVELDNGTQTTLLANIVAERKDSYTVVYMSPTKRTYEDGRPLYRWENDCYTIDKESVSGFYDSKNEEDAGMIKVEGGWVRDDPESEYEPSGSETETDTDESIVESEED
jgi:hypothetical protein